MEEVRWDRVDTVRAGDYNFFPTEKEAKIINWELEFFYAKESCQQLRKQSLLTIGCL